MAATRLQTPFVTPQDMHNFYRHIIRGQVNLIEKKSFALAELALAQAQQDKSTREAESKRQEDE